MIDRLSRTLRLVQRDVVGDAAGKGGENESQTTVLQLRGGNLESRPFDVGLRILQWSWPWREFGVQDRDSRKLQTRLLGMHGGRFDLNGSHSLALGKFELDRVLAHFVQLDLLETDAGRAENQVQVLANSIITLHLVLGAFDHGAVGQGEFWQLLAGNAVVRLLVSERLKVVEILVRTGVVDQVVGQRLVEKRTELPAHLLFELLERVGGGCFRVCFSLVRLSVRACFQAEQRDQNQGPWQDGLELVCDR